jgi:16S rRNA (guanine966-N2)-methyltransferase
MSLKILGGFAKGLQLNSPSVISTRPTSVMLRRRLFDAHQNLNGIKFIDLFSGTGAVALEACSRGAEKIIINEINKASFLICKKNIEKFESTYSKLNFQINFNSVDSVKWLEKMGLSFIEPELETIIFIDPPYEQHHLYLETLKLLQALKYQGEVWIESDRLKGVSLEKLKEYLALVKKEFHQGDHFVLIGRVI